jgi:hypothetical protein
MLLQKILITTNVNSFEQGQGHSTLHQTQQKKSKIELHAGFWEQVTSMIWNFSSKNDNCCHILVPGFLSGFLAVSN